MTSLNSFSSSKSEGATSSFQTSMSELDAVQRNVMEDGDEQNIANKEPEGEGEAKYLSEVDIELMDTFADQIRSADFTAQSSTDSANTLDQRVHPTDARCPCLQKQIPIVPVTDQRNTATAKRLTVDHASTVITTGRGRKHFFQAHHDTLWISIAVVFCLITYWHTHEHCSGRSLLSVYRTFDCCPSPANISATSRSIDVDRNERLSMRWPTLHCFRSYCVTRIPR